MVCGLLRGWGSSIVRGVEIVRRFLVEANEALKPHTKQPALELIESDNYAVSQLWDPVLEVAGTVLVIGFRFVVQAVCYALSGAVTFFLALLWRGAQVLALYLGHLYKGWCIDACLSPWREVACALFCPNPAQ